MLIFDMIKGGKVSADFVRHTLAENNATATDVLEKWTEPTFNMNKDFLCAYRSKQFLVQVFKVRHGATRISINRTELNDDATAWKDGITWDEIQDIKKQIGFGDRCAVEIYPPDANLVNVANMRHIFLLKYPPTFMWKGKNSEVKDGENNQ